MRLLLLPVALGLALAGCLAGTPPPVTATDTESPVEVGALAHVGVADAAAAAWHADAKLVGVTATEGEPIGDNVDPPLFWNTAADPNVGNGKALVWTYAYAGEKFGVLYYVSTAADGTILYARELPLPYYWHHVAAAETRSEDDSTTSSAVIGPEYPRMPTLTLPALDSDAAIAVADTFEDFAQFAEAHPRHQVMITLGSDGETPIWGFLKRTATYFGASAAVDGDGQLLYAHSWPQPPTPCDDCPYPEPPQPPPRPADYETTWSGSVPGRLSSGGYAGGSVDTTFDVESSYWFRSAAVQVKTSTLPGEFLFLRILDPMGHVVWETAGSSVLDAVIPWGMEGTYTVELRSDGGGLRDIPFDAKIQVLYDEPGWRDLFTHYGMLSPWSGPFEVPFGVGSGADELVLRVSFGDALPAEGIRWLLESPDGVWEEHEGAIADFEVRIGAPQEGSWRLKVWPQPTTVRPIDVSAIVEIAYVHGKEPCCWM